MSGVVVWFTGLPASGKSTLARAVREGLSEHGVPCCLLDGDVVRRLLFPELGYSEPERARFYARLAALSAELARQGLAVLVPATAHRAEYRRSAREQAPRFIEVWVSTSLEECRRRDDKGLYAAAAAAAAAERTASDMPGVGSAYEAPTSADLQALGGDDAEAAQRLVRLLTTASSEADTQATA